MKYTELLDKEDIETIGEYKLGIWEFDLAMRAALEEEATLEAKISQEYTDYWGE